MRRREEAKELRGRLALREELGHLRLAKRRLDHRENTHAECVGLGMGVLHVMAFGVPILAAWLKETMFRARFASHNLLSRSLEVLCYLFMIIGASTGYGVDFSHKEGEAGASANVVIVGWRSTFHTL